MPAARQPQEEVVTGQADRHAGGWPDRVDLIVVGAGINGAAIAREAALAGLGVALFDQGDIGGGTSAGSTRLVHGGLRYLEHAELSLVYESLHERERLLRQAPHLVTPLEIVLPVYRGAKRPRWQIGAGLTLYDLLAFGSSLPRHRRLGRGAVAERLPGIATDGLVGGAAYHDAQASFPERLVVELVVDAAANGARVATHTKVTDIRVENGAAAGVEWRDRGGTSGFTAATTVVNAAGPWVDRVLGEHAAGRLIGGTKGSHLVTERFPGAPDAGVYTEAAADGRPFFILPWNGLVLIGTTDLRFDADPAEAAIDGDETLYLIRETERVFPGAAPLEAKIVYTQSAVRPLPYTAHGEAGAITRRHLIVDHPAIAGLVSIVGGKLTTHRALAEEVLRHLAGRLPPLPAASPTRSRPFPGAVEGAERQTLLAELGATLGTGTAARLVGLYGRRASGIAELARAATELGQPVAPQSTVLTAELVHAIDAEAAVSLADILQRRCMAGLAADFGLATAAAAAARLADLGRWDRQRVAHELDAYRALARRAHARSLTAKDRTAT